MKPEQFGKYTLIKQLGQGGMAEVFLAACPGQDGQLRALAIKRLLSSFSLDREVISMMTDEARLSAWLVHPAIVQVLDFGQVQRRLFMAMEYVDGCDLCDLIRRGPEAPGQPLPLGIALFVLFQVTSALEFAHRRHGPDDAPMGIIHRDVSPHNVLLSTDGEVKLTDFGLARAAISLHHSTADIIRGKFSYMPREQAEGRAIDHRVDIFAAGATLYEALTGLKPYRTNTLAEQLYQLRQPLQPPSSHRPEIPSEVDAIVRLAMAPEPHDRYPTAAAMAADLQRALLRFSSLGRELEALGELVRGFIGDETANLSRLPRMTLADIDIDPESFIGEELLAARQALRSGSPGSGDGPLHDVPTLEEVDALVESDSGALLDPELPATVENPMLPEASASMDLSRPFGPAASPVEPRAPVHGFIPALSLAASAKGAAALRSGPSVEVDLPTHREPPPPSLRAAAGVLESAPSEDAEAPGRHDTVLAPEEGLVWAPKALPPELLSAPDPDDDDIEDDDDGARTIQRSPEEMLTAFERALVEREQQKQKERQQRRKRQILFACLGAVGLVIFVLGFYAGRLLQQGARPGSPPEADLAANTRQTTASPAAALDAARPPAPRADVPRAPDAAPSPDRAPDLSALEGEVPAPPSEPEAGTRPEPVPRPRPRPVAPRPAPAPAPSPKPAAGSKIGFLSVNTDSPARIYIGDSPKSMPAPIRKLALPAGIHRVRAFFETQKTFSDTQWVSINPGQTFTLYFSSPAAP